MAAEPPLSPGHHHAARAIDAALQDPACIMALTGPAGAGKSFLAAAVAARHGRVVWHLSARGDDLARALTLLHGAGGGGVLIIDDADVLPVPALAQLFAQLARDRSVLPRLLLVARPELWRRLDDPRLAGARDRIGGVATLFPLDAAESMRLLEDRFDATARDRWARTLVGRAGGNPGVLLGAGRRRPTRRPSPAPAAVSRGLRGVVAVAVLILALAALSLVLA